MITFLNARFNGGARPGRARSNDLAAIFLSKEINVYRREHKRNDAVSVNLPPAKM